ncbi:MAG TPA: AraC family transcriptional regulator [Stellaceae bacterium]|jgi:AraC family transcriptional regulator|nr:AraC family transcriptional regulator [Stellaceae bacterium]
MTPVAKALWLIEHRSASDLSLDEIARLCDVSRFYMSRAFVLATGHSVMRYLRARRLTEAARALAAGAPDILAVALDAGYGSHEAFTRAFRDRFGMTPDAVRSRRHLDNLATVEAIRMDGKLLVDLAPPRVENGKALLVAGLAARYTFGSTEGIPAQWQRFAQYLGHIPGQVGDTRYGVSCNHDDAGHFDYITGVEVADFADFADEFARVRIPAQRYAVFSHREHIAGIRGTIYTIWNKWLPESGHQVADAPNFERYGPDFDPRTGTGVVEIWVPIKA